MGLRTFIVLTTRPTARSLALPQRHPGISEMGLITSIVLTTRPTARSLALPQRHPGMSREDGLHNNWRLRSESNRRTRSCSPLHDHSATQPVLSVFSPLDRPIHSPEEALKKLAHYTKTSAFRHALPALNSGAMRREIGKNWSGKRDSNSRPRPWQGRALPTELFPL